MNRCLARAQDRGTRISYFDLEKWETRTQFCITSFPQTFQVNVIKSSNGQSHKKSSESKSYVPLALEHTYVSLCLITTLQYVLNVLFLNRLIIKTKSNFIDIQIYNFNMKLSVQILY